MTVINSLDKSMHGVALLVKALINGVKMVMMLRVGQPINGSVETTICRGFDGEMKRSVCLGGYSTYQLLSTVKFS